MRAAWWSRRGGVMMLKVAWCAQVCAPGGPPVCQHAEHSHSFSMAPFQPISNL